MAKIIPPFELCALKFKDQAGLREILSKGYFREGHAWGSVRCGWEIAIEWEEVWSCLAQSCQGQLASGSAFAARLSRARMVPPQIAQGAADARGERLWMATSPSGFEVAAGALWAVCEAWLIAQSAAAAPQTKAKPKPKGKANGKKKAGVEPTQERSGPRRL